MVDELKQTKKSEVKCVTNRDRDHKFEESPTYGDEGGGGSYPSPLAESCRRSSDEFPHDPNDEDESFYETFTEKQHERGPFNQGNRFLTPEQPHPNKK